MSAYSTRHFTWKMLRLLRITVCGTAAFVSGCVSSSAPEGSQAPGVAMGAGFMAAGIATSLDPTGISHIAGGVAYQAHTQARIAQAVSSAGGIATDPNIELSKARALQRQLVQDAHGNEDDALTD